MVTLFADEAHDIFHDGTVVVFDSFQVEFAEEKARVFLSCKFRDWQIILQSVDVRKQHVVDEENVLISSLFQNLFYVLDFNIQFILTIRSQ